MTSLVIICPMKQEDATPWLASLRSAGEHLDVVCPPSTEAVATIIRQHAGSVARVIVAGGDGTLRCAAAALQDTGLPVGILPLGTANDLAHSLGIPMNPAGAAAVILRGRTKDIDVGVVNGQYFFNAAQIGLGAHVKSKLSERLKRIAGPLSYAIGAWDALRHIRSFSATVDVDGDVRTFKSVHITVGNGVRYGGGAPVAPAASLTDETLDFFSVDPLPAWRLVVVAAALRSGRHYQAPHVHALKGRHIRLETSRSMRITADGEDVSRTPADFTVLPAAVSVYTGD